MSTFSMTRRQLLQLGAATSAGAMIGRTAFGADSAAALPLITRPIPSSGEKLPVIGLGTNNYNVTSPEDLTVRREVLRRMPELGGTLVDTAPSYGRSEEVIGQLVSEIGNRNKLFYATKVTAQNGDVAAGRAMLDESFRRLRTDRIELDRSAQPDGYRRDAAGAGGAEGGGAHQVRRRHDVERCPARRARRRDAASQARFRAAQLFARRSRSGADVAAARAGARDWRARESAARWTSRQPVLACVESQPARLGHRHRCHELGAGSFSSTSCRIPR